MDKNQMDYALFEAAKSGNAEHVVWLMQQGGSFEYRDASGLQAHHIAARHGHMDVIKAMFAVSEDNGQTLLESKTNAGQQILHYAAGFGHVTLATYLLESGAKQDERNKWGNRPIDMARMRHKVGKMPDAVYAAMLEVFGEPAPKPKLPSMPKPSEFLPVKPVTPAPKPNSNKPVIPEYPTNPFIESLNLKYKK